MLQGYIQKQNFTQNNVAYDDNASIINSTIETSTQAMPNIII